MSQSKAQIAAETQFQSYENTNETLTDSDVDMVDDLSPINYGNPIFAEQEDSKQEEAENNGKEKKSASTSEREETEVDAIERHIQNLEQYESQHPIEVATTAMQSKLKSLIDILRSKEENYDDLIYDILTLLEEIKVEESNESNRSNISITLLYSLLKRKTDQLEKQRESYLNELAALRTQLFKATKDPYYKPQRFTVLKAFEKKTGKDIKASKRQKDKFMDIMKNEEEKKFQETSMTKMLELEKKLKEEQKLIEEQKQRLEFHEKEKEKFAKKQAEMQEENKRLKQMIQEERKQRKKRDEDSPTPKHVFNDITPSVTPTPVADKFDTPSTPSHSSMASRPPTTPSEIASQIANLVSGGNPSDADKEAVSSLENQISHFQNKFSDLYEEMDMVKKRLQFYETDKSETKSLVEESPTGEVALVFTDVQDSTRLWELGCFAMQEAIKKHNEVLRGILKKNKGYEVKTEGDAFMIAFRSAVDALEFAVQGQIGLVEANWDEGLLKLDPAKEEIDSSGNVMFRGLRVRMGIHIGTPICEKDPLTGRMDYFGPMVNRSARVSGQASGGQVVVSAGVWQIVQDKLEALSVPVEAANLGNFALKGLEEKETLFQIMPKRYLNRTLRSNNRPTEDSAQQFKAKLEQLQNDHQKLEEEQEQIEEQIQYKLRIQTLETGMKEKDEVIKYLKEKVEKMKTTLEKEQNEEQKSKLQKEMHLVLEKYESMRQEYDRMKNNFESAAGIFNETFKKDISKSKDELSNLSQRLQQKEKEGNILKKDFETEKEQLRRNLETKTKEVIAKDEKIQKISNELENAKETIQRLIEAHAEVQIINSSRESKLSARESKLTARESKLAAKEPKLTAREKNSKTIQSDETKTSEIASSPETPDHPPFVQSVSTNDILNKEQQSIMGQVISELPKKPISPTKMSKLIRSFTQYDINSVKLPGEVNGLFNNNTAVPTPFQKQKTKSKILEVSSSSASLKNLNSESASENASGRGSARSKSENPLTETEQMMNDTTKNTLLEKRVSRHEKDISAAAAAAVAANNAILQEFIVNAKNQTEAILKSTEKIFGNLDPNNPDDEKNTQDDDENDTENPKMSSELRAYLRKHEGAKVFMTQIQNLKTQFNGISSQLADAFLSQQQGITEVSEKNKPKSIPSLKFSKSAQKRPTAVEISAEENFIHSPLASPILVPSVRDSTTKRNSFNHLVETTPGSVRKNSNNNELGTPKIRNDQNQSIGGATPQVSAEPPNSTKKVTLLTGTNGRKAKNEKPEQKPSISIKIQESELNTRRFSEIELDIHSGRGNKQNAENGNVGNISKPNSSDIPKNKTVIQTFTPKDNRTSVDLEINTKSSKTTKTSEKKAQANPENNNNNANVNNKGVVFQIKKKPSLDPETNSKNINKSIGNNKKKPSSNETAQKGNQNQNFVEDEDQMILETIEAENYEEDKQEDEPDDDDVDDEQETLYEEGDAYFEANNSNLQNQEDPTFNNNRQNTVNTKKVSMKSSLSKANQNERRTIIENIPNPNYMSPIVPNNHVDVNKGYSSKLPELNASATKYTTSSKFSASTSTTTQFTPQNQNISQKFVNNTNNDLNSTNPSMTTLSPSIAPQNPKRSSNIKKWIALAVTPNGPISNMIRKTMQKENGKLAPSTQAREALLDALREKQNKLKYFGGLTINTTCLDSRASSPPLPESPLLPYDNQSPPRGQSRESIIDEVEKEVSPHYKKKGSHGQNFALGKQNQPEKMSYTDYVSRNSPIFMNSPLLDNYGISFDYGKSSSVQNPNNNNMVVLPGKGKDGDSGHVPFAHDMTGVFSIGKSDVVRDVGFGFVRQLRAYKKPSLLQSPL